MKKIKIKTKKAYEFIIESGMLKSAPNFIKNKTLMIVCDEHIFGLYEEVLRTSLQKAGFNVHTFVTPNGEEAKSIDTLLKLLAELAEKNFTGSDAVLAFGGGTVGDVAALAAGLYHRGIDLIQFPTSLLSAIDSSIGGKSAVNLKEGKNLIGLIRQPSLVICDPDILSDMDGFGEAIKYAILEGGEFSKLLDTYSSEKKEELVLNSVKIKTSYVEGDEEDKNTRHLLNLGHTVAHAIEKSSNFEISHGKAVALGLYIEALGCKKLYGDISDDTLSHIKSLLEKFGFADDLKKLKSLDKNTLLSAALMDKKINGNTILFPMIKTFGNCELKEIDLNSLSRIIEGGLDYEG